jgi:hypothetical protein
MRSKLLIAAIISVVVVNTLPGAAYAAGYTAQGPSVQVSTDGTGTLTFSGFEPNERTTAAAPAAVTLASIRTVTSMSRAADASGSVDFRATASEPGSYTITVTGQSGTVSVGTLTVLPVDGGASANAGGTTMNISEPLVWAGAAAGVALLALAFVLIRRRVRLASQNG